MVPEQEEVYDIVRAFGGEQVAGHSTIPIPFPIYSAAI